MLKLGFYNMSVWKLDAVMMKRKYALNCVRFHVRGYNTNDLALESFSLLKLFDYSLQLIDSTILKKDGAEIEMLCEKYK